MNIKEAKNQIKNAMTAYFTLDEFSNFAIPVERQRPVFLMGPPGIGKTAIMEQIAQELGVGLVAYSMTHHTRQSALGLPFIVKKVFDGTEYDISEYTMSEIIASVYEMIENSGTRKGILFLDEINCVSETLAPTMLQFLQYKVFGRFRVPEGWIVVTAGNPPEYNKSVREFDIVTWDRLKRIDVEPDFEVWKEYASNKGIHASILTYLEIRKGDFYLVETTVDGKKFVTARGWDDLSNMIQLYEQHGIVVDEKLIQQYLQEPKIARNFSIYYDLFNKYKSDYQIEKILAGKAEDEIKERARAAKFDERISLLGLLLEAVTDELRDVVMLETFITELLELLKRALGEMSRQRCDPVAVLEKFIKAHDEYIDRGKNNNSLSSEALLTANRVVAALEDQRHLLFDANPETDVQSAIKKIKADFDQRAAKLTKSVKIAGIKLSNLFQFISEVFGEGQETLILVTELTMNFYAAKFINHYGCEEYFKHNKELLFYERQKELILKIEKLDPMSL